MMSKLSKTLTLAVTAATLALPMGAVSAQANPHGCPPGLAKKGACGGHGHDRHSYRDDYRDRRDDARDAYREGYEDGHRDGRYRVGEYLTRDYVVIRDPGRYGLDPRWDYRRVDGQIYRVDRNSNEILALIGAVSAILN